MHDVQGIDVESQYSLGHLLLSFLDCFGNTFDYKAKAVSVRAVSVPASHHPCRILYRAARLHRLSFQSASAPTAGPSHKMTAFVVHNVI